MLMLSHYDSVILNRIRARTQKSRRKYGIKTKIIPTYILDYVRGTKYCVKCDIVYDISMFYRDKTRNRFETSCKKCRDNMPKNKKLIKKNKKIWENKNPEKVLKYKIKHLESFGYILNMNYKQFRYSIQRWSKIVRKRDNLCIICNSTENLHAHHIFYKSKYPKFSLILNNGVSLCKKCHEELHILNR